MRVTDIEINSGDTRIMDLNLRSPRPTDKYLVKGVYGLDADEIIPRYYASSLEDPSTPFLRMGLKDREITIRVALSPNWRIGETYSELRDQIYRGIASSRTGTLQMVFKAGETQVAYTDVSISKFEVPYSTQESEIQITFGCVDPIFRSLTEIKYLPTDFDTSGFLTVADSVSTAPHGLSFELTIGASLTSLIIQDDDANPTWSFTITPASPFLLNDSIYINTEYGSRSVVHSPVGGGTFSLLDRIVPGSVWPTVFPGPNRFYMPALNLGAVTRPEIIYRAAFWGI